MDPGPVTPSKSRANATDVERVVNSTPGSVGSALVGPIIESTKNDEISPWIARDLLDHSTCGFEDLLRVLLESCWQRSRDQEDNENPPSDLLQKCLEVVMPIANGTATPPMIGRRKKKAINVSASSIRDSLVDYCLTQGDETARYAPFANAFNAALLFLSDVHVSFLPSILDPDAEILFHRNDPTTLTNRKGNHRKPDIVLVPFDLVKRKRQIQSWDEAMSYAAECPGDECRFDWTDILCSLEFKRVCGSIKIPPVSYTLEVSPTYVDPEPMPVPWQLGRINTGEVQPEAGKESDEQSGSASESSEFDVGPSNLPNPHPISEAPSRPMTRSATRRAAQPPMLLPTAAAPPHREATSSNKRKSDSVPSQQRKKIKAEPPQVAPLGETPAMVRAGMYAVDRMSESFDVNFTINIILRDDVARVWWYDRQGVIQTHGINFVQNLPHFLVLILAFQRFNGWNWGHNVKLRDDKGKTTTSLDIPHKEGVLSLTLAPESSDVARHYGMVGRATTVIPATSTSLNPRNRQSLEGLELVVKMSWAEKKHVSEGQILEAAYAIAEKEDKVKGHLPELIFEFDFEEPECCTATIRQKLGMGDLGARILRMQVFVKLYAITRLRSRKLWRVYWECFECHYYLWRGGLHHRDISVNNLMYSNKEGLILGVVNDFDLSTLGDEDTPNGTQRTGTVPYMAMDLLTDLALAGKVEHLYRHDAESFIWVLLVTCTHYHKGTPVDGGPFRSWMLLDHGACMKEKLAFFFDKQRKSKSQPTRSYLKIKQPLGRLLNYLDGERGRISAAKSEWEDSHNGDDMPPREVKKLEKLDGQVFQEHMKVAEAFCDLFKDRLT